VPDRVLRGAIVHELSLATRYAREVSGGRLRAAGVDPAEYGFLSLVGVTQPVTRTALAKATGMRRTTLRDALRQLIERGHVVESPHPTDGRSTVLNLSPAGQEIFVRGVPVFREFLASLDDELEGKLDELEQAVWQVRIALERLASR
jgi:DNA-binding MarR family transcriptional regulator